MKKRPMLALNKFFLVSIRLIMLAPMIFVYNDPNSASERRMFRSGGEEELHKQNAKITEISI